VWFEVEVLEAQGKVVVGFAGTNFRGSMVGYQDTESWSVYSEPGGTFYGRHVTTLGPTHLLVHNSNFSAFKVATK
jgi:hypothetical protein